MLVRKILERLRLRAHDERAQSIVELIVVMAVLGIVVAPISAAFATSMRHQAGQTRREEAQSSARAALQRMRLDIHCAHATTLPLQQNDYGGFTLMLPENPGQCPGVVPLSSGASGVAWCTIPYPGSTTRFRLFRLTANSVAECNGGTGATFEIDYIAAPVSGWPTNAGSSPVPTSWAGNIWPTSDTCTAGSLPSVAVDINVSQNPTTMPNEGYELIDRIAALNADPC